MNTENVIVSASDDVIFENRNKAYGAYVLRKSYELNLSKGSLVSFLFLAFLFAAIYGAMLLRPNLVKSVVKDPRVIELIGFEIIPDKPVAPKQVARQQTVNRELPPRVVDTDVAPKPEPVTPAESSTTASTEGEVGPGSDLSLTTGFTAEPPAVAAVAPPQTVDFAEVMPEFEGGKKALYRHILRMIRYPSISKRNGEEGTVLVRFVVDITGAVTNVEVIRSVTGSLDKEATRVIGKLPNWKPGSQHGAPVNVRMVLPITFALSE